MPNTTIRKLLRRGVAKEDVVENIFRGYKNTIHHTEYWRKQIKKQVVYENAKLLEKKKMRTMKKKKQKKSRARRSVRR